MKNETKAKAGFRPAGKGRSTVFLNVPFDEQYWPLFVALLAGLTALGLTPHCVLEVPSSGRNRLDRIYDLLASCAVSIHDLSRVTLSGSLKVPRFNMPFELGVSYARSRISDHRFFVFEERAFRIQQSLSDLNGIDPMIHGGTVTGILGCLLDCFGTEKKAPPIEALQELADKLLKVMKQLRHEREPADPYSPAIFRRAVKAATTLARLRGLIR